MASRPVFTMGRGSETSRRGKGNGLKSENGNGTKGETSRICVGKECSLNSSYKVHSNAKR